jgi:uncharacterized membrane protein YGL010W
VLLEILFFFGYRADLYAKIMRQVDDNISQFKKKKA